MRIDFTEGRLSLKLDASGGVLRKFIASNNQVLQRFTPGECSSAREIAFEKFRARVEGTRMAKREMGL
jgi:hypothetical protein